MAFEIVDGMTGTKHISSDDLAALNTATVGKADCVLKYGNDFALTMASANSATLGTGVGMVGGKRFWNQAATSLTIQSGAQGQKRNDLVVARYAKTSAGIESITPVVIKGTPTTGTPADPAVTANDLKLWRVPLNGINAGTPVRLFEPVIPLAALGDSVSQGKKDISENTKKITQSPGGWRYLYGSATSVDKVCYRKTNNIVEVSIDSSKATESDWKVGTLPAGYRPSADVYVSAVATVGWTLSDHTAYIQVKSTGVVWCGRKSAESNGRILGYLNYLV